MEFDIRKNIIKNLKDEDLKSLIETIDVATNSKDELVLPGLGVFLELFWHELEPKQKEVLASLATKKMNS